jgi:hypothetical protein
MTDLVEPYTNKHTTNVANLDNWIFSKRMIDDFASHKDRIDYVSNTLKSGRLDQSMVIKLFLTDDIYLHIDEIIDTLKILNFKFIVIKRKNIEHHLLSYAIALASNKWHEKHDQLDKIKIIHINHIDWLYKQISNFDRRVKQLNIEYNNVQYENALSDLALILNQKINTNIKVKKQIVGNPWDMIENSTEIKEIIQKITNGKKIY